MKKLGATLPLVSACMLEATRAFASAEWSVAPVMSWSIDQRSNRLLSTELDEPSAGGFMYLEARLKRTTPSSELVFLPSAGLQRYTEDFVADADSRALHVSGLWSREHSALSLAGNISEHSTLTSELTETGVVEGDTRRRAQGVSGSWQFQHSERRSLEMGLSYSDVEYHGDRADRLLGYAYPRLTIGERFGLSERTSLLVSGYGGELHSSSPSGGTRDTGLQATLEHAMSDRLSLLLEIGASEKRFTGAEADRGMIGRLEVARQHELSHWRAYYSHSVVPSGFGVLIDRDEAGFSLSHALTSRTSAGLRLYGVKNSDIAFLLSGERRRIEGAEGSFDWRSGETSTVGLRLGADRTKLTAESDLADGWWAVIRYTWTPELTSLFQ